MACPAGLHHGLILRRSYRNLKTVSAIFVEGANWQPIFKDPESVYGQNLRTHGSLSQLPFGAPEKEAEEGNRV